MYYEHVELITLDKLWDRRTRLNDLKWMEDTPLICKKTHLSQDFELYYYVYFFSFQHTSVFLLLVYFDPKIFYFNISCCYLVLVGFLGFLV